jgi:hypothetical protein
VFHYPVRRAGALCSRHAALRGIAPDHHIADHPVAAPASPRAQVNGEVGPSTYYAQPLPGEQLRQGVVEQQMAATVEPERTELYLAGHRPPGVLRGGTHRR